MSDDLVAEANRSDEDNEIAGPCMEALLEGDCECWLRGGRKGMAQKRGNPNFTLPLTLCFFLAVLGRLVKLTANDRVAGSQAEVVRLFASLIILLDERFLSRQAVHRPLVRLMRICVGDEFFNSSNHAVEGENEDEEVKAWRRFGRDGSAEMLGFEEDLVDMMCHVASRLRNTPELLIIFFRDRGGDAEAKRAFNKALTGVGSPSSLSCSKTMKPSKLRIGHKDSTAMNPVRATFTSGEFCQK